MRYTILFLCSCLFLSVSWLPLSAVAQVTVDSTRSSYREEHINYSEEMLIKPFKEKVKQRAPDTTTLRVQREEKDLWKLGLNNFTPSGHYTRYGLHLAYERKVGREWSIMGEVSPAWLRYRQYDYTIGYRDRKGLSVRTQLAGRYYYNLERRIRQGRGAGNFSANYLSLAFGNSFGRFSDLPFYLHTLSGSRVHAEAALLYGVQRRLGRYGFIDFNAGVEKLLTEELNYQKWQVAGSLRIGLVIGAAPPSQPYASITPDVAAQPRVYVGAHAAAYSYSIPIRRFYTRTIGIGLGPYLYAGYYIKPRLAVQAGLQYQKNSYTYYNFYPSYDTYYSGDNHENILAIPLSIRYTLTKDFMQRVQFDVVAGAALLRGVVKSRSKKYVNNQFVEETITREERWNINPMAGLNILYGLGRLRKVQLVGEAVLMKPLANDYGGVAIRPGVSLGLRYRFKYL